MRVTPMTVEGEGSSFPFNVRGAELFYGLSLHRLSDVKSRHYLAWLWCKIVREHDNPDVPAAMSLIAEHGSCLDEQKGQQAWPQILREQQVKERLPTADQGMAWGVPTLEVPALDVVSWSNHKQGGGTMPENLTGDDLLAFVYVDAWLGEPGEEPPRLDDPMVVAEARDRDESAALSLAAQFE